MPLNKSKLQTDLNKIIAAAAEKAFKSVSEVSFQIPTSETYLTEKQIQIMKTAQSESTSKQFGKVFAENSAKEIAEAIDAYVKSATITYTLASSQGPVTGKIQIT